MNAPSKTKEDLLTLLLSGELNGMDNVEFARKYFPAEDFDISWECFERWAEARKNKIQWELFQIDPSTDPAAVGIAFAPAEQ